MFESVNVEVAAIWAVCHVVTALCYFHIPVEIAFWIRRVPSAGVRIWLGVLAGLILWCGAHHLNMLTEWRHNGDTRLLLTGIPMMLFSLAFSVMLVRLRAKIHTVIRHLFKIYAHPEKSEHSACASVANPKMGG